MTQFQKRWGYMIAPTKHKGIFQKKGGGYLVRLRVKDLAGVRQEVLQSLDTDDELEVLQWARDRKTALREGIPTQQTKLFSDFAVSLLARKIERREIKSKANISKWEICLDHLIKGIDRGGHKVRGLGDFPVTAIRTVHIEMWKDQMAPLIRSQSQAEGGKLTDGYAPTTVNGWLAILRVISRAISREYEIRDFMDGVKNFTIEDWHTYTEEEPNSLRPEDVPRFLESLKTRWPQHYAMTLLGLVTGLRPSTLRPLRRRGAEVDVLWDEARLLVRRSEVRGDVRNRTKTGIRYSIHLPQEVLSVLKWHVDTQLTLVQSGSDLLFPSVEGGFRDHKVLNKPFRDVADHIGLGYEFTQRGMRRTFQDLARAAQVESLVTRSISGHATEQMREWYSTVSGTEQRASLTRVFTVIQGGKTDENTSGEISGESDSQSGGIKEKAGA